MKIGKAFRYELEPALLARRWELDDLVMELKNANHELDGIRRESLFIEEQMKQIRQDWSIRQAGSSSIDVGNMQVMQRYLGDLSERYSKKQNEIGTLEKERNVLNEKVMLAKSSLEILEEHKVKAKKAFFKSFDDMQLKQLDDQWNVLRPYREKT